MFEKGQKCGIIKKFHFLKHDHDIIQIHNKVMWRQTIFHVVFPNIPHILF